MNAPTVLISASCFVFVQVDELLCVVIEEKFAVKGKVGGRYADSENGVAPDFAIAWNIESGALRKVEVVRLISIIAAPNHAARLVINQFKALTKEFLHHECSSSFAKVYSPSTERSKTLQFIPYLSPRIGRKSKKPPD